MEMKWNDHTTETEERVLQERRPKLKHLFRLFGFVFNSTRGICIIYLGAFILLSLMRPVLALLWGRYIQEAAGVSERAELAAAVFLLVLYFAVWFLTELLQRYVYLYDEAEQLNIVQANRQQEKLYARLYRRLSSLPPEYFEIPKINDRIEQVFRFTTAKADGLNTSVMLQGYVVVSKLISVFTIALSLSIFDPWLCLIVLLAPLPTVWNRTLGQKLKFEFMKDNTGLLRKADYFQRVMLSSNGKELKTFGLYDFFYRKWKEAADEYMVREQKLIRAQSKFLILNALMISLATAAGMAAAILLMAAGRISLGALGAVFSLVSNLVADMKELLTGYTTFHMKKNEAAQFFDLMDLPKEEQSEEEESETEEIQIKGVSYRYPMTERYVLEDAEFTIRKGERVAFVGENGAGKSTMVKLLSGILKPSCGEILFRNEGQNLCSEGKILCGEGHRGAVSAVFQEPARYLTFSVADNIYLGDVRNPQDVRRMRSALSFAGLEGLGADVLLGKEADGTALSGGQWQKLAIARSVYRDKGMFILDEPTSGIDPLAEAEILKKYLDMAAGRTVVFVTHRIGVAALADRIVVFSKGRIVQEGTHEQLISQGGEYARLYREQAKWYER